MHYLVPFVMLFGFLSMQVRHDGSFGMVMPVVLVALGGWSFVAILRKNTHTTKSLVVSAVLLGLFLIVLFSQYSVVSYSAFGPSLFGAPIVLAVLWAALTLGTSSVVLRRTSGWLTGLTLAVAIGVMWSLVVNPALFALGLLAYYTTGVFYGIPFAHTMFWGASTAMGVAMMWWTTGRKEQAFPLGAIVGPLCVVSYATGVCIAVGAWIPAVLGLALSQLGLRAMYYL